MSNWRRQWLDWLTLSVVVSLLWIVPLGVIAAASTRGEWILSLMAMIGVTISVTYLLFRSLHEMVTEHYGEPGPN